MSSSILRAVIDETPWIDTHEHLVEERHRLGADGYRFRDVWGGETHIPGGWTALISHYAVDDVISAGRAVRLDDGLSPGEQWDALAAGLHAARSTGYLRAVELTTERLFGLPFSRDACDALDDACRSLRRPGYYGHVLRDVANVRRCHVNSVERDPCCDTATPDLLDQDIALYPLVAGAGSGAEQAYGASIGSLDDYTDLVEWCFDRYGDGAVAAKCAWAYFRPLAVRPSDSPPRRAFERLRLGTADRAERRSVEDYLFEHALAAATRRGLPVKLHLGYLAGNRRPQMRWVGRHVRDVVPLLERHPSTTFVLMHAAWPHQEELIAVAKHFPNAIVDLCWAWMLAPLATIEFVRRFLTTAPASKLLCFGGDYLTVETVVGHAELARRGLAAALESLVDEGWISADRALELVPMLMHGNAEAIFGHETAVGGSDRDAGPAVGE